MSRTRTRVSDQVTNVFTYPASGAPSDTQITIGNMSNETCVDNLGKLTDHPLTLTHNSMSGGKYDWQGTYHGVGTIDASVGIPSVAGSGLAAWLAQITAARVVSSTAPLRPRVNAITNVLELGQVPRMLRQAGDLLLNIRNWATHYMTRKEQLAAATLAYQFGWAPLLSDLSKIWDFGNLVQKKQEELGALNSGKTVRRKIRFGNFHETSAATVTLRSTLGVVIQSPAHLNRFVDAWATIHWSLLPNQKLARPPTWLEAFKVCYGLTAWDLPIQIWKALPWSWLIDWFANLSESMEIAKNLMFYQPSRINKMWSEYTTVEYEPLHPQANRMFAGAMLTRTIKNRSQLSANDALGLHLSVPFLDAFKLSILGSLTIVKLARR